MEIHGIVQVPDAHTDYQLGYYSGVKNEHNTTCVAGGECRALEHLSSQVRILQTLNSEEAKGLNCVLVDIRSDARSVLAECKSLARQVPLIALASSNQQFDTDYPYGVYVSDTTTEAEIGQSIFWHRIKQAVRHYETPISGNDVDNPVYRVFESVADLSSEWVFIKDLEHRFITVGEHFVNATGLAIENIVGRNDLEIGSDESAVLGDPNSTEPGFWQRDEEATSTGIPSVEQTPNWSLYSATARQRHTFRLPLKNSVGNVYGLLVCSRDVTEQLENSLLLKERTRMLKQVTEEKGRAESHRQIAESAVAAKTRFMAAASHDLRQPLHAIGLFLDSLDKKVSGEEEKHLVLQIKQCCASLGSLFAGCLDVSKLDAGAVERHMEHLEATAFLGGHSEEFRRLAVDKSLEFRLSVDSSVFYTDEVLLSRIIRNLFVNALQNTRTGFISIECHRHDSFVKLSVRDSGQGIPPDQFERIFQEFHQVSTPESAQKPGRGLGLGLSIVKRLCELIDISIELESQPGQGACFTLSIPFGESDCVEGQLLDETLSVPHDICVLIVEDDPHIRHGMEVLLESYGCSTISAENTDTAISLTNGDAPAPDIIVADYHLAGNSTGVDAINLLRQRIDKNLPAVLVTGDTSMDSDREAASHQLPVLHKPVDTDELLATIKSELKASRQ